jgi:hypothetical protein
LRVTGIHHGHWDPYVEMLRAFDDYNKILQHANDLGGNTSLRVGLLMYCQAIEITAVHEVFANLYRCKAGKPFVIKPFLDLQRPRRNSHFLYTPPSINLKIRRIKELASESGDTKFHEVITTFFDDQIRNAFIHSDYCITDSEFRWTEGGPASSKGLDYISELITRTFAFYEALIQTWKAWLYWFKEHPKYIKMPQYEVFELITNEDGLFGFAVHFSNGQKALFERHDGLVTSTNLSIERDGSVNFFVGDLTQLERTWKVNGEIFDS